MQALVAGGKGRVELWGVGRGTVFKWPSQPLWCSAHPGAAWPLSPRVPLVELGVGWLWSLQALVAGGKGRVEL